MKPFRISVVHRNVGYLSILQIVNLAIPLITLLWVLRALGADAFGRVGFYQAIVRLKWQRARSADSCGR